MYAKHPYEAKYQFLINKRETTGLKHLNDSKVFIEYSSEVQDVYKNMEEYNADKEQKILLAFDDMINNKKLNSVVTELFVRGRKLKISLAFITQSYFKVLKDVRLNFTHFFNMKIQNKRKFNKLKQIIHQILILKFLLRFTKNVLLNHILC